MGTRKQRESAYLSALEAEKTDLATSMEYLAFFARYASKHGIARDSLEYNQKDERNYLMENSVKGSSLLAEEVNSRFHGEHKVRSPKSVYDALRYESRRKIK